MFQTDSLAQTDPSRDPISNTMASIEIDVPTLNITSTLPIEIDVPQLGLAVNGPVEINIPNLSLSVVELLEIEVPILPISAIEFRHIEIPTLSLDVIERVRIEAPVLSINAQPIIAIDVPVLNLKSATEESANDTLAVRVSDRLIPIAPSGREGKTFVCAGTFDLVMLPGTASGQGANVGTGTPEVADATITSKTCGRDIIMSSQGQKVSLKRRSAGLRYYEGSIDMGDGVNRTLGLTCSTDGNLIGQIMASDANIKVQRQMALKYKSGRESAISGCKN